MKLRFQNVLLAAAVVLLGAAPTPDPKTRALLALHWSSQTEVLAPSNSTIAPPKGVKVVRGTDAQTFHKLTNGESDSALEAVAVNFQSGEPVFIEYFKSGYVAVDDWNTVNAASMLSDIKENTESSNADRKAQGIPQLHVLGWIKEPAYDAPTKTVRFALSATSEGQSEPIVNSIALVLGRYGYEKLVWVTDRSKYVNRGGMLDNIVSALAFNPGSRYADHTSTDKLAGYGLAALVGTAAGAALYKVGAFAAVLLLFKKVWFLIIAAIAGIWRWFTNRSKANRFGPPSST